MTDLRTLPRDARGAVTVEYAIVLCLVAVGVSLALIELGALLFELFRYQRGLLALPFP